jgi:hypothetical protein
MRRAGLAILTLTLGCALALPAYSITATVERCTVAAQGLLDAAEPLDRNPPPRAVAAVIAKIGMQRLAATLATVLLDRFSCAGDWIGADWLFVKPALSRQLGRTFDGRTMIALYASTADMGKNTIGFNRGALRLYDTDIGNLDDVGVDCLMRRATGAPTGTIWAQSPPGGVAPCLTDFRVRPVR